MAAPIATLFLFLILSILTKLWRPQGSLKGLNQFFEATVSKALFFSFAAGTVGAVVGFVKAAISATAILREAGCKQGIYPFTLWYEFGMGFLGASPKCAASHMIRATASFGPQVIFTAMCFALAGLATYLTYSIFNAACTALKACKAWWSDYAMDLDATRALDQDSHCLYQAMPVV